MALPTNVGTGTVEGTFVSTNGVAAEGTITFTPRPKRLLDATSTPPATLLPTVRVATVEDGILPATTLVATNDPDLNPSDWTYKVTFNLTVSSNSIDLTGFDIEVPEGGTVDLTLVAPVGETDGFVTSRGVGVPEGGAAGQVLAKTGTGDYETAWVTPAGGSDPAAVKVTGDQTVAGTKTFTSAPVVPDGAFIIAKVTGLQAALDGKAALADGITSAERTKLTGIATGATANDTDANLKNRANHTGSQAQSTITNLTTDLAAKAPLASPTFTGTVTVPDGSFAIAKLSGVEPARTTATQAEAEAGTGTTVRGWTAQRIAQAIAGYIAANVASIKTTLGLGSVPYTWSSTGSATAITTGSARVNTTQTLAEARMRVGTAPSGSALTVVLQRSTNSGTSWTDLVTLTIASGSTTEAVQAVTTSLAVGDLLRLNVTSVGSTTAATGAVVEVYPA